MNREVPAAGPLRRLLLCGLSVGVVACALPTAASGQISSCPGADESFSALTPAQAEVSVVCLSNAARIAAGLSTLEAHGQLRTAARRHAEDMQSRGYFDHVAPAPAPHGTTLLARVRSSGYPLRAAAENLASGQPTPRRATVAWLNSPGHCNNLLDPAFDEVGVGRAAGAPIWVQVLGTRATPSTAGSYPGCESGAPPSIAGVASGPPSEVDDSAAAGPKPSGVKISTVRRSGSRWTIRLKGSKAVGRTATVRTYGALRRCVKATGQKERCSTVPGSKLSSTRVKLKSTTTARLARRASDAFVRVSLPSFRRDGTQFAAATVTRKLPR
jgi:uncharacterized protein YkwD